MILDVTPPDWQRDALCAQVDWKLFFPEKGGSPTAAQRICHACPVTAECLSWALDVEDEHGAMPGVYGGTSAIDRRRIRHEELCREDDCEEPTPSAYFRYCQSHSDARRRDKGEEAA